MTAHPLVHTLAGRAVRAEGEAPVWRTLPEEAPVALVYDGTTHAVMMASPDRIRDLATGFSLTEGIIASPDDIADYEEVAHGEGVEARMWLAGDRSAALMARRRTLAGPVGCGLCGIDSIAAALAELPAVRSPLLLGAEDVAAATERLRACQPLHDETHAAHAAGFLLPGRGIVLAREDVGRHNALDKLVGAMARAGIDAASGAFVMTSRVSVELVQKCAMAGCPALIAVSAPTALALRRAEAAGITLAAFARDGAFDVFSHPERILASVPELTAVPDVA
ncbi:formate dehydrogenase accessory sulfurtransferase FdhD [Acuticoccus sediminis]|uniref:Sulfur carrier protein FdhD n=1 Tax=Acuticoccus sediminis TaxID=2184697 RepID=A0A8B2NNN4_9HYPH|nr:formate dehydrogenase accessory sulfurtransferase FdhD [Acuticoccus sediminis]RAH97292.1 formate dehydrogenase accessory sulfurtransferase FdhD [Acuticoccus sediminis]